MSRARALFSLCVCVALMHNGTGRGGAHSDSGTAKAPGGNWAAPYRPQLPGSSSYVGPRSLPALTADTPAAAALLAEVDRVARLPTQNVTLPTTNWRAQPESWMQYGGGIAGGGMPFLSRGANGQQQQPGQPEPMAAAPSVPAPTDLRPFSRVTEVDAPLAVLRYELNERWVHWAGREQHEQLHGVIGLAIGLVDTTRRTHKRV